MPMDVTPVLKGESIWGFQVGIYKDGVKLTDISFHVRAAGEGRGGDGRGGEGRGWGYR